MLTALKAIRRDPWTHILVDGSDEAGWIIEDAIGFGRIRSRANARRAAGIAAHTAAHWYATRLHQRPVEWPGPLMPDAAIAIEGVTAGRLVPPGLCPARTPGESGIEIAVPADTWLAVRLQLAQQIYTALVSEGVVGAAPALEVALA